MTRLALPALALLGLLLGASASAQAPARARIKITSAADLPVHSYAVTSKKRPLAEDPTVVSAIAAAVSRDTLSDLAQYDIIDRSTLRGMYHSLETVALLQQDFSAARQYIVLVRSLQDKPADQAVSGLLAGAMVDALQSPGPDFHQTLRASVVRAYRSAPSGLARSELRKLMPGLEVLTPDLFIAAYADEVTPDALGRLSPKQADALLSEALALRDIIPNKADLLAAYSAVLTDGPAGPKADLWAERDVTLTPSALLSPVVVAVWDTGVDISLYKSQRVSGQPGIAFDARSRPTTGLLSPLPGGRRAADRDEAQIKGSSDFRAGISSPEAAAFKANLSGMTAGRMHDLSRRLTEFSNYAHGTHVAGIALRGNPAARLLVCRVDFALPTSVAAAERDAAMFRQTIAYFKTRGVRVVNMSWRVQLSAIRSGLEARTGKTADEQRALAKKIYGIGFHSLSDAIRQSPGILFIAGAGNENQDVLFDASYPAGISAPNLMVVGAVDQSGEETSFTSFGNVDVYADGVDVPSFVPGGATLKLSGTSMAAPQVTNLAAKMLAERPSLSVAQVRAMILSGSDRQTAGGRTILLINPKRTLAGLNAAGP